jgi:phosphatidylinositol kinase/protein kinase (PI-3  family)
MVGYVLGLGDRHPSNIMIDQLTGNIMHVDFGDCFEAACKRARFPEKVPFRLTRMMVSALEVSGIDGIFRTACENTMETLREHDSSVLAVLAAFVHDPLVDWFARTGWLAATREKKKKRKSKRKRKERKKKKGGGGGGGGPRSTIKTKQKE